jgi:glycosyltransferase involved in cell wall biosynthesis
MKTAIIVSSLGRPKVLHDTILALGRQARSPNTILLSLCDAASVLEETKRLPLVRTVHGPQGLTKQRNTALRYLPAETKYVLFLDDDVELAPNYLESMERLLDAQPGIALASGAVCAADGPRLGRAVTREEAVAGVAQHRCEEKVVESDGAYGCNMFVKRSVVEDEHFDERLPLESWLEDYDFSVRCSRRGHVVWNHGTCVAHLGVQRGQRERGFSVGYAQIANSHHLWRKGVIPSLGNLLGKFWLPALRISLQGSVHGKPPWNKRFDYKGRLRGNVRALFDAARFRLQPERILDFARQSSAEAADAMTK